MDSTTPNPEAWSNYDLYDRTLGLLDGVPGVLRTKPTTIQIIVPMVGSVQTFNVLTLRQQDFREEDGRQIAEAPEFTLLIEQTSKHGVVRMVLPPKVTDAIIRQRDALTGLARKRSAKRVAADRKARGIKPSMAGLIAARAARKARTGKRSKGKG